ncbi:MAG: ClC family H(+)/Cl(-) exchange transporter [Lactobacillus crispatus]|jgi:H+/Cl- antiporter ClcA|uniref:ClC family H(+)/Cl(-) exchange transporter n=2 Tax=Lactobacillus TaxID=1578 RepID=UPI0018AB5261|nr:ClC family H(+)/Cl(-) exchange transporter [Lactobacillus crispatus]MCH4004323.1 ClC family H(+)/Cl(-) exchange transporter [Lactobacillus crispatus]MCI1335171.1 ClC family H(+)/Cl(-) exchange transporter [Lactobacillus crispatus]MCI1364585.1 ClC family H(+)/Cl(-) exchange transporter [Lactobacillus crispatus]MCI1493424.1 ClC family H(+)/Cl(-) exchange transporter [Lactobacillus crispatus]MCI1537308.1 ClC family H(+)/Cl(-) exchange transporter [Lactobacillus crispatus]
MIKNAKQILAKPFSTNMTKTLVQAISVGLTTGVIVSAFRWIIDQTMQLLYQIYPQMAAQRVLIVPYILLMFIIAITLGKITTPYLEQVIGSGVPQIEAVLLNENKMPWWSILWRKFIGGLLAICPGLMLGREGPCIEMGAMVGQGLAEKVFKSNKENLRTLQECGVAAGLAAAFSAPIAGALFLVEEITFDFKPQKVVAVLAATFSADFVTILAFGNKPCLYLPVNDYLPVTAYWALPLIGIFLGIMAYIYQYVLLSLKPWFSKIKKIPAAYHSIIPLILIIPVGLFNAHLLGGSHVLIDNLFNLNWNVKAFGSWDFLLLPILFLIIRFVFSMLSYGSSVPGGIFMPILVLGALLGIICANIMIKSQIILPMYFPHILVISMAAYFGAIEKAPFTAIMLLTEMIGTVQQVLPMIIVTFVAYYILDILGGKPIYEALRLQMNYHKNIDK